MLNFDTKFMSLGQLEAEILQFEWREFMVDILTKIYKKKLLKSGFSAIVSKLRKIYNMLYNEKCLAYSSLSK